MPFAQQILQDHLRMILQHVTDLQARDIVPHLMPPRLAWNALGVAFNGAGDLDSRFSIDNHAASGPQSPGHWQRVQALDLLPVHADP